MNEKEKQRLSRALTRLVKETVYVFGQAGEELNDREAEKLVLEQLAELWPSYLAGELGRALGTDPEA